jgi:hypothetical protein
MHAETTYSLPFLVGALLMAWVGCASEWTTASAQSAAAASRRGDTTSAARAGLAPEEARRLAALGAPVAVPTFVPNGFAVKVVRTRPGGDSGSSYRLRYGADDGTCFVIETATGGLGGPAPPRRRRPVASPLFPAPTGAPHHVFWTAADAKPGFPPHSLFSSWLEGERLFYRLASGGVVPGGCRRLAPAVAVRIVESLRWLNGTASPAGPPNAFDRAAYAPYALNRPFAVTTPVGASARAAALHVLGALGLRPDTSARKAVAVKATSPSAVAVRVAYDGLRDDSVAGMRYLVEMRRPRDGWVLRRIGVQYRCQAGRGHRGWAAARCL